MKAHFLFSKKISQIWLFTSILWMQKRAVGAATKFECKIEDCCDSHELCKFWASANECIKNIFWMSLNCRLTCNTCSASTTGKKGRSLSPTVGGLPNVEDAPKKPPNIGHPRSAQQGNNNLEQCSHIQLMEAQNAIEAMKDGGFVVDFEDTSFRRSIASQDIAISNAQDGCAPQQDPSALNCQRNACYNVLYRTMDGTCNNLQNPQWGASATPLIRLRPFDYDDGVMALTGSLKGGKPSAREASRFLLSSPQSVASDSWNVLLMQFGQFVVHDVSKTSILPTDLCQGCVEVPGRCAPIRVDQFDPRFGCGQPSCCLGFTRAAPVCGLQPRTRLNENSAFIDGSQIYGSSAPDSARLRGSGQLRESFFNNRPFMPFEADQCQSGGDCAANFDAGDSRVTIFVGLAALHALFLREHNRLATQLHARNPQWSSDRVFQESRKIVGAQLQVITFEHWLPKVIGAGSKADGLSHGPLGRYAGYDVNVNPSIADEVANGALRFGHGMVPEFFTRLDANGQSIAQGNMAVDDGVLKPQKLLFEGGTDAIVRGMMSSALKRPQRLTPGLTERMFGGTDLGATNIQRGRDAGLPGYNTWREFCGLKKANSFDELHQEISDATLRNNLKQGYAHPDNVDLYVAALVENPTTDSLVGPTIACMLKDQFTRLRNGDRFWYENPGIFTADQLVELKKATLSRIICDNGDNFQFVAKDAFHIMNGTNLVPCSAIGGLNLDRWSD